MECETEECKRKKDSLNHCRQCHNARVDGMKSVLRVNVPTQKALIRIMRNVDPLEDIEFDEEKHYRFDEDYLEVRKIGI